MSTPESSQPATEAEKIVGKWFDEGYEAGRLDPKELLAELRPAIEAEAAASLLALSEILYGIASTHYYDGSGHRNSNPDCRMCQALAPWIEYENKRILSKTNG